MDLFLLYVWTRLDPIVGVLMISTLVLAISIIANVIFSCDEIGDRKKQLIDIRKKLFFAISFTIAGAVLIPNSKDSLLIMGGSAVLDAARSDSAKRIASKSVELIERAIDRHLKEKKE